MVSISPRTINVKLCVEILGETRVWGPGTQTVNIYLMNKLCLIIASGVRFTGTGIKTQFIKQDPDGLA